MKLWNAPPTLLNNGPGQANLLFEGPQHQLGHHEEGVAIQLLQDEDVEGEDPVGLINDSLLFLLGDVEAVEETVPTLDECLYVRDPLEVVEAHPLPILQAKRPHSHAAHHLPAK
eukprot:CAMPEP_0117686786 /NCGR_PEP_ID=MMETSP0804-20121206/22685_1 /TAXON_ID=1074897 /ORGANISM="Tetraselmis astigmatica, Strain CCMP880" /LENGTH=113 /DNA_ID=CAMNT_0005498601 /DNA_START=71 /DNA_END=413 /DNA_ORIENTATION=-